jgi:hypothetical protein
MIQPNGKIPKCSGQNGSFPSTILMQRICRILPKSSLGSEWGTWFALAHQFSQLLRSDRMLNSFR